MMNILAAQLSEDCSLPKGPMPDAIGTGGLPAALPLPIDITIRNAEQGVNQNGKAARLDPSGLVATVQSEVRENTILYTTLDMRSIKATARGLIKVKSQRDLGGGGGYEIIADFLELSDDARQKIERLLGRRADESAPAVAFASVAAETAPAFVPAQTFRSAPAPSFLPPIEYQQRAAQASEEPRRYFEPSPLRGVSKADAPTRFWGSLGVGTYLIVILIVLAIFPKTRAIELYVWHYVSWSLSRMWYWANHIGEVKLWGQSPN
jgi:hypothetical protein